VHKVSVYFRSCCAEVAGGALVIIPKMGNHVTYKHLTRTRRVAMGVVREKPPPGCQVAVPSTKGVGGREKKRGNELE
jgi:hypothetical protein